MKCPKCNNTDVSTLTVTEHHNGRYLIKGKLCIISERNPEACGLEFDTIEYAIPLGATIRIIGNTIDNISIN